jgi:nitrilase
MASKIIKIGALQAEPAWLDLQGGVEKTIGFIQQAGSEGIKVLGFPEVWIPGYPKYVFSDKEVRGISNANGCRAIWTRSVAENVELIHDYMDSSLSRNSPEMSRIKAAVKDAGIFVVLGYSERAGGSLYIAQSFIDATGEIVHHRRKIKPTGVERAVWADGQGDSLKTVVDTPFGRVGALNCWEHFQPLLRYYEYSQGVQIHVAGWPPMFSNLEEGLKQPFSETDVGSSQVSQFLAMEGQAFVLVATQVVSEKNLKRLGMEGTPFKIVSWASRTEEMPS